MQAPLVGIGWGGNLRWHEVDQLVAITLSSHTLLETYFESKSSGYQGNCTLTRAILPIAQQGPMSRPLLQWKILEVNSKLLVLKSLCNKKRRREFSSLREHWIFQLVLE